MQRLIFDDGHDQFHATVRDFMRREVEPNRDRYRAAGVVDRALFAKAGQAGLLCTWADERFGGAGIDDFRFAQVLIEENFRHGDSGFYLHLHSDLVAPYLAHLGSAAQQNRFMPGIVAGETILAIAMTEPSTGSDLAGIRCRATRDGDNWVLDGVKTYISNGTLADLVIVAVRTDPASRRGISLFLVERGMPGFERGQPLNKMGLKSHDTAELFFNDCRVPAANVLGEIDQGSAISAAFSRRNSSSSPEPPWPARRRRST